MQNNSFWPTSFTVHVFISSPACMHFLLRSLWVKQRRLLHIKMSYWTQNILSMSLSAFHNKNKTIKDFANHWILTGLDGNHCKPSVLLGTRVISPKNTEEKKYRTLYCEIVLIFYAQQCTVELVFFYATEWSSGLQMKCVQMKPWLFTYKMKPAFFCLNKVSHK